MKILNVGAGKQKPLFLKNIKNGYVLVNLDKSYFSGNSGKKIEQDVDLYDHASIYNGASVEYFCSEDIFKFMEKTRLKFDMITMYRFLEHVPFDNVLYFLYLLSTIIKRNGIVDVIVPDYEILAEMLLDENPYDKDFEANDILLTTEMLNEPSCPHASIWTIKRAYKFFEFEQRFKVMKVTSPFTFDGRDVYMRFQAKRV